MPTVVNESKILTNKNVGVTPHDDRKQQTPHPSKIIHAMSLRGILLLFFTCLIFSSCTGAVQRLCGLCKVCTELARFALSHNTINNFLLLHCSSIIPSRVCLAAGDLLKNVLHSLSLGQICQLERMCSVSEGNKIEDQRLNFSQLQSYDVDAINIILSRIDSVENFTDLTAGVGPALRRMTSTLAATLPLMKDFRVRDDQQNSLATLTNRFLMALDYKLRSTTGEGLRQHLKPCKDDGTMS